MPEDVAPGDDVPALPAQPQVRSAVDALVNRFAKRDNRGSRRGRSQLHFQPPRRDVAAGRLGNSPHSESHGDHMLLEALQQLSEARPESNWNIDVQMAAHDCACTKGSAKEAYSAGVVAAIAAANDVNTISQLVVAAR